MSAQDNDLLFDKPQPVWELPEEEAFYWLKKMYPGFPRVEIGQILKIMRGQDLSDIVVMKKGAPEYERYLKDKDNPDYPRFPSRRKKK